MATIKSFTSLEQSKILAKILPIESADMYYEPSAGFRTEPSEAKFGDIEYAHPRSIRCWSLAALLSVLPANKLEKQFDGKWWFSVYLPSGQHKSHKHDNPIDACYEIIVRLNELKLL